VSTGTLTASLLDEQTQAVFVGEPTPARADNFLCRCQPIEMPLTSADLVAGKDPVLDAVLAGTGSESTP
jgi:hypothetical protein